jgi:CobQ-like glutamine amidotransferase family enzyme
MFLFLFGGGEYSAGEAFAPAAAMTTRRQVHARSSLSFREEIRLNLPVFGKCAGTLQIGKSVETAGGNRRGGLDLHRSSMDGRAGYTPMLLVDAVELLPARS